MPVYRTVAVAGAAAVLLAVLGLAHAIDGPGTGTAAGTAAGTATATGSRTGHATSTAAPDHGAGSSSPRSSAGSTSGGTTDRGTTNGGSASPTDGEQPAAEADSGYRLPSHKAGPSASARLLGSAMPPGGSGRARLVRGFPTTIVPVAPRSRVSTNSVSPSGGRLQVSLVATRDRGPDTVLRFYRARLGGLGFSEKPTHAVGGSTAAAFARGGSSVVVTVTPARPLTYSVFAILDAGAS